MKLAQPWIKEIAPGVFRLGSTYVGFYAVEDRGAYTLVDTGLPRYWSQLAGFLASQGLSMPAVKAVVLTHCHIDHRGNAERLRKEAAASVLVHGDDLASVGRRDKVPNWPMWKPRVLRYFLSSLRSGAARPLLVTQASIFRDEEVLDVPGHPKVIHTPGHTLGNAAVSLEAREVLIAGDTLATLDLVSGESGPRLLPNFMNADHELALESLHRIEHLGARWVLPGHGLPWEGSPQEAVARAREVEVSRE